MIGRQCDWCGRFDPLLVTDEVPTRADALAPPDAMWLRVMPEGWARVRIERASGGNLGPDRFEVCASCLRLVFSALNDAKSVSRSALDVGSS
jgi:hypothetical protein